MIKASVFDVDGVLIDSMPSSYRVKTSLFADYGVNLAAIPDPHGQQHKGNSFKDIMTLVGIHYPDVVIDKDVFKKRMIEDIYNDLKSRKLVADPALVRFLDELRMQYIPCAIASAGLREGIVRKLELLGIVDFFKVIVSADDVAEHKPHPASYLMAVAKLGVKPEDCVVFEDSKAGVQAGFAAGAKVVGFTGYTEVKQPLKNTIHTIDSWTDIDYHKLEILVAP